VSHNRTWFAKGIHDGIPISLGYLAVSFTLGIAAKNIGLTVVQASSMSLTKSYFGR
jgi:predicted branched-subunit amino acid permease